MSASLEMMQELAASNEKVLVSVAAFQVETKEEVSAIKARLDKLETPKADGTMTTKSVQLSQSDFSKLVGCREQEVNLWLEEIQKESGAVVVADEGAKRMAMNGRKVNGRSLRVIGTQQMVEAALNLISKFAIETAVDLVILEQ